MNQTDDNQVMLNIQNLVTGYGKSTVLKGVSLKINRQEIVALVGANGAGKTTTLRSIFGLTTHHEGSIWFKGQDITNLKAHKIVRSGLGYVPQDDKIFPSLSVLENLEMGAYTATKSEFKASLELVFSIFPILKQRTKQKSGTLSGGERQMLAIGRSLMINPDLLLLDEPSLGLAPLIVEEVFNQIKFISNTGVTVLVTEQNAQKALEIADRGYIMEFGTIHHEGSAEQLLQDDEIRRVYLGED